MKGERVRGRRRWAVLIALSGFVACGLEDGSDKHACAVDADCIAPRACLAGVCGEPAACAGTACAGTGGAGGTLGTGGTAGRGDAASPGGATDTGMAGESGTAGDDGTAGAGGTAGAAGTTGTGGTLAMAGAAGALGDDACDGVNGGVVFEDHCFVDVTNQAWTHPEAVVACGSYANGLGRTGYLLVIDSPQEQTFVLETFMTAFTDVADAWLSLTCPVAQHPDLTDCYCTSCTTAQRNDKRQNWVWRGNATASFGWDEGNPNGDGRCGALAFLPVAEIWAWGDHDCDSPTFETQNGGEHTHRAICELE